MQNISQKKKKHAKTLDKEVIHSSSNMKKTEVELSNTWYVAAQHKNRTC